MDDVRSDVAPDSFSLDAIEQLCIHNLLASREERIFFKNREGRFLLVSQGWLEAEGRGLSLENVIGKTDFDIFSDPHASAAFADEQRVIETGEPIVARLERETFGGDRPDSWVSTTKMPLLGADGTIVGTWGVTRDVTAQLEDEETIRRHAQGQAEIAELGRAALRGAPLHELFDSAVGAAWRVLCSDFAWLVACGADGSLGISAEVGWLEESEGGAIAEEENALLAYAGDSRQPIVVEDWDRESRFPRSTHRTARGVRSSLAVLVGAPDSPFGLLEVQYTEPDAVPPDCVAFLDALANVLTEAIQSRDALAKIRDQGESLAAMTQSLRTLVQERERLIDQIPGVVFVGDWHADGSGRFEYVSRRSATILGVEPGAFIEDPECFLAHVHVDDRDTFRTLVRARATVRKDPLPTEIRFIRPDGEQVWLRVEACVVNADALAHRVQAVLFDITAAKQAGLARDRLELELRLAQKLEAVGQLAAGVAHEINTPIQFIGDSVRFLKEAVDELFALTGVYRGLLESEDPISREERQRRAAAAEEESDLDYLTERVPPAFERALLGIERVASIVHAMRQFSHPTTERALIDINDAIQTTLTVATNEYKYVADIDLDLGDLPLVTANPGEVNQVLLNLIVNAAHAIGSRVTDTGERGTITMRTRTDAAAVTIAVSDTGCGIAPEIAGRVFDPFFTTKEVGRGTGQGLAIAHTIIVERHHGTISFEPAPDGGATFTIVLPLDSVPADRNSLGPAA